MGQREVAMTTTQRQWAYVIVAGILGGAKTSVSLEDEFWNALKEIAGKRAIHLSDLVAEVDEQRGDGNLSSALRLFVLDYYQRPASNAE